MPRIRVYIRNKMDGTLIADEFVDLPPDWDAMSTTDGWMHLRSLSDEFFRRHIMYGARVIDSE